ncbi:hypothetical protein BC835DRAFT_1420568 [Cytidiella melzeri]|nr:hypothetical protein BC835DRAFT_1420568 [Cytidiella melzeri]
MAVFSSLNTPTWAASEASVSSPMRSPFNSKDWNGNRDECPLSEYSVAFKETVDLVVRAEATAQGKELSSICLNSGCGASGVVAIAKKMDLLGHVYLNCPKCKGYQDIAYIQLSEDAVAVVETMRAEEVQAWKARGGPEAYLAGKVKEAVAQPSPPSSQLRKKGYHAAGSKLRFKSVKPEPSSSTLLPPIDDALIRAVQQRSRQFLTEWPSDAETIRDSPATPPNQSPVKLGLSDLESDLEVQGPYISRPRLKKRISVLNGSKDSPISISSSLRASPATVPSDAGGSMTAVAATSGTQSPSAKRKNEFLVELFCKKGKMSHDRVKANTFRKIHVVIWYQVQSLPLVVAETVPPLFRMTDLKATCDILDIKDHERFAVYYPGRYTWAEPLGVDAVVADYPANLDVILIRREGVFVCPGFHTGCAQLFAD